MERLIKYNHFIIICMYKDINFKVAIKCYTYNHAPYIEDALNGFCMQETNFPFLCVVVDDASTDGESEIITNYIKDHFKVDKSESAIYKETDNYYITFARHYTNDNCYIVYILLKYNHYSINKSKDSYIREWIQAEYISMNEGDDYWIDPNKLQKQINALDEHSEVDICACAASLQKDGKELQKISPSDIDVIIPVENVILGGGRFVATNSIVYRSSILKDEKNVYNIYPYDYFLQIGGALRGGMLYIADCMAVYRYGVNGSWTVRMNRNPIHFYQHRYKMIENLIKLDDQTNSKFSKVISTKITELLYSMFRAGLYGGVFSDLIKETSFLGRMHFALEVIKKAIFKL